MKEMEGNSMRNTTYLSFIVACFLAFYGCKADDPAPVETPPVSEPVPSNIFPLVKGKRYEFSGYLTSGSSETMVTGSTSLQAIWVNLGDTALSAVLDSSAVTHIPKSSATLFIDSLTVPGFLAATDVTPVFVYKDNSSGDYYYLTNFGYVFRYYKISADTSSTHTIRGDSLNFIRLAPAVAKTMEEFPVYKKTVQSYAFGTTAAPLEINIVGKYEKKENLTLSLNGKDTTVTAYSLVITSVSTLGALPPQSSVSAKFWLAEGIGPVQMFLAGDNEAPGSFRKLKIYK